MTAGPLVFSLARAGRARPRTHDPAKVVTHVAGATRTRARKPAAASNAATPKDVLGIVEYINSSRVVERALELRILLIGALAGLNIHLIGRPGLAKSLTLREFVKCIDGAKYFEKVMQPTTPPDAVIGSYDMAKLAAGEGLVRKVEGYAPWAHVLMLDELPRANGATRDSLLPLLNTGERLAEHNGGMMQTDILFVVTASNTWFDQERDQALANRITFMLEVDDIRDPDNFKRMIRESADRRRAEKSGTDAQDRPTVTLDAFMGAMAQVRDVGHSPEYLDKLSDLRRSTKKEGLYVSPRQWTELDAAAAVPAWLSGRAERLPDDLVVMENGLWREQKERPIAAQLVQEFHGRFVRMANEMRGEAAPALQRLEGVRPKVEATPPNVDLDPSVLREAIAASRLIDASRHRVMKGLAEAETEKRDAPELRELADELLVAMKWLKANGLPTQLGEPGY